MNMHSPSSDSHPAEGDHHAAAQRRPSGRRAARSVDVRTRLLDAAERLIAERQSAAITARHVARSAGVSDGVLYNHFADKHELLVASLVRRFERLAATFRDETSGPLPSPAGDGNLGPELDRLVAAAHRLHAAALPMLANVVSEPALFRRFMVAIHGPSFGGRVAMDVVEGHLQGERAAGRLGEVEPAAATDLVVGAVLLVSLTDLLVPHPPEVTAARLGAAVRTLVLGLAPRPPAITD